MKDELQQIFNKIDEIMLERVYIQAIGEDEDGEHRYEMYTIDDINCNILSKLIDELYEAVDKL